MINSDILCDWPLSKAFKVSSSEIFDEKLAYLVLTKINRSPETFIL